MDSHQASKRTSEGVTENGHRIHVLEQSFMEESVAEPVISAPPSGKIGLTNQQSIILHNVTDTQVLGPFPSKTAPVPELPPKIPDETEENFLPKSVPPAEVYEPVADEALDDETTLEDEERNAVADVDELDELGRLGEMPLEELLKMYGAATQGSVTESQNIGISQEIIRNEQLPPMSAIPFVFNSDFGGPSQSSSSSSGEQCGNDGEEWCSTDGEEEYTANEEKNIQGSIDLMKFLASVGAKGREQTEGSDTDDSSTDEEFVPVHLLMLRPRETPIGAMHQVDLPERDSLYADNTSDPSDQVLSWAPRVPEEFVRKFLKAAYIQERELLKKEINPTQLEQTEVADDGEFLKEFLDCNFDTDEALRRCRRNFRPGRYESSKWSEKECEDFETAIVDNWKRFNVVQAAVPTRTVKEVVEFYYRWKKSNRFEVFLAKIRMPDGRPHDHLEEKIKVRVGKKRAFDAMDAIAEDQLALQESTWSTENRQKIPRLDAGRTEHLPGTSGAGTIVEITKSELPAC